MDKLPNSYYIGQEFVEDTENISAIISWHFYSPALIKDFSIPSFSIVAAQEGGAIFIQMQKIISKKLFESILSGKSTIDKFIIGYINRVMPIINQEINNQKYLTGHLLNRNFCTLDIRNLHVIRTEDGKNAPVLWPPSITSFPPSEELAPSADTIYIRDLIDSTTSYYTFSLDDCIRRIITSLENFYHHFNLKGTFRKKLKLCLDKKYFLPQWGKYLDMLYENMIYIYSLRNCIVHDNFRIHYNHRWICKKGIGTLFYIYQNNTIEKNTWYYIYSLMQQFLMLDAVCNGLNLDHVSEMKQKPAQQSFIIEPSDLDEFVFSGLTITSTEKETILKRENA